MMNRVYSSMDLALLWPGQRKPAIYVRLFALLLLMPFLMASTVANGQKVTLKQKNVSLEQVFQSIKKQTGYSFLYDPAELVSAEKVSIDVKDASLQQALDICFQGQELTYKIFEATVVVKKKVLSEKKIPRTIKGVVRDENGVTIPGVSIILKGSTTVAITDKSGNYLIQVTGDNPVLVFSYVGFATQEVNVGSQGTIDVKLFPQDTSLNQVVVVGYGTQKRSDITGSVSSVKMKDLEGTPVRSVDQVLQGRVAGVSFVQSSGMPGGGSSVRIRGGNSINGSNEPLYVIDGVPVFVNSTTDGSALNPLNNISPSDIESMEVLKDASATAIYGSRGGNGVVLITTKRGVKNRNNIALDVYTGFQDELKRYQLLNAKQFETLANDASLAEGGPLIYDPALNPVSTDWQNELFRSVAPMQSYQLSASGGSDKSQYLATFSYFDQQGIIKSSDLERYSLRLNADYNFSPTVKFGSSVTFSNVTTNRVNAASLSSMSTTAPNLPIRQLDGSYTQFNNQGNGFNNPVALINGYMNKNGNFRGLGNAYVSAELIKGLTVRTMWGMDAIFSKNDTYMPQSVYSGSLIGGDAEVTNGRNLTWLNENTINYNKTFGDHRFDVLAGFTQQSSRVEVLTASARGFLNDNTGSNNLGLGSLALAQLPASSTSNWALLSWLGRINYALKDRYLLTLTSRYDGSSRFGKNNRWGFFPSAAFAWRGIEEDFIKQLNVFSDLKVRASYGLTGNQEGIGNYRALDLWGASNYVFDGNIVSGITPTQISNQNLKWESTLQTDIGIELGFFKNRLTLVVDAYHKKTRDLLLEVTVPASSGFTDGIKNIGSLENKGLEFTINAVPLDREFKWNTSFNISFNKNKVLDLGVEEEIIPAGLSTALLKVGQPVGNFLGYVTNGLFQSDEEVLSSSQPGAKPGDLRYVDFNGDGLINILDRRVMGNAQPICFGGLNNSFAYKGFDLSFFLQFVYGNEIYNLNRNAQLNLRGLQNQSVEALDRWTPDHRNTIIPRASSTRSDVESNTTMLEDGSYLRLKNVQMAYNIPSLLTKKVRIQSVKIYANVQNLLTFSNYSGLDPEVSRYASDNVRQGYDSGAYPSVRTFTLGILAKF